MTCGILLMTAVWLAAAEAETEKPLQRHEFTQLHMGIPFSIALYAPDEAAANKAAASAYARIKELNAVLSDYNPDSELMQLVRRGGPGRPVKASPDLRRVLKRAIELSRQTEGAFDVTIGPAVQLWRQARRSKDLPTPDQLAAALDAVGWQAVRVDDQAGTVELLKPEMRLDFGGIAPGFAADEALAVLKKHGISRALVEASGDMAIGDPPPGRHAWRIGIAPLEDPEETPQRFLLLKNQGVATSGSVYRYVEIDGRRYSHIVDPKTGVGLTQLSSVTVVAPDAATADALASGLSVLGPKRGMQLIDTIDGAAALFMWSEDGTPEMRASKGLEDYEESSENRNP